MTGDVNIRHTYPYSAGGKSSDLIKKDPAGATTKKNSRQATNCSAGAVRECLSARSKWSRL